MASRCSFVVTVAFLTFLVSFVQASESEAWGGRCSNGAVNFELFTMSQCPYSTEAIQGLNDAVLELGIGLNVTIQFVGGVVKPSGEFELLPADAIQFSSLHGESEVTGDLWEICAMNRYPSPERYMPFLACMSREQGKQIPSIAEQCVTESDFNWDALNDCVTGKDGTRLLSASFEVSKERHISSTPTIFIGGRKYLGSRDKDTLLRAVCYNDGIWEDDKWSGRLSSWVTWLLVLGSVLLLLLVVVLFVSAVSSLRNVVRDCRNRRRGGAADDDVDGYQLLALEEQD